MIIKIEEHGTANSYNKGCRCGRCKKAKVDYRKDTPIKNHGTKWYYDKGCRCELCTKAKMEYRRELYPEKGRVVTTDLTNMTRLCYSCKKIKPLDEFGKNINSYLGRCHECRICRNERSRRDKNTPLRRFATYKSGANVRKIPFGISYKQFISFWNKNCYYCGTEIDGIGLDRKNPSIGYNVDNVVSCCSQCNRSKTVQTTDQFISMCLKIAKRFKDYSVSVLSK